MEREIKKLLDEVDRSLERAEMLYKKEKYGDAVFLCQQALEKGLKAYARVKYPKEELKVYSLISLSENVKLPKEYLSKLKKLCPDQVDYASYKEEDTMWILELSEEVLKWIEKQI
tara:strand:+ start:3070 stop:3414 length:345 start_codon:yes stop_codon:yes gene_type:complete